MLQTVAAAPHGVCATASPPTLVLRPRAIAEQLQQQDVRRVLPLPQLRGDETWAYTQLDAQRADRKAPSSSGAIRAPLARPTPLTSAMLGVSRSSPKANKPGSAVALLMSSQSDRPRTDLPSSRYCSIFATDSAIGAQKATDCQI